MKGTEHDTYLHDAFISHNVAEYNSWLYSGQLRTSIYDETVNE